MYGTLSFGKGDKSSSAEFHAVPAVNSRRQRQPACDACKVARVKCRGSADGDKCGRCCARNRPCTYNSIRRKSRHSEVSSDTAESTGLAANSIKESESKAKTREASPLTPLVAGSVSSPQQDSPLPLLPSMDGTQWWGSQPDCPFEPFEFMLHSGTDEATTVPQEVTAASHQEFDGDGSSRPADPVPVDHSLPDNYDFSNLCHQLTPQTSLSKQFLTSMSTAAWGSSVTQQDENKRPSVPPMIPSLDARGEQQQQLPKIDTNQDDATSYTSTLTGFSDLMDVMQFAKGPSGLTTPASDPNCTCLQDLTASLFSLRSRAGSATQVDEFLVLFRQAMRKWEAAETCPSACCSCRSFALLLLMNVQELVTLLLEVASAVGGGGGATRDSTSQNHRDSVPEISLGAFTVEDEADQGIIAHIILAARMKELHSFITRMSSKTRLASLDDVSTGFNNQMKALRGAFST